MATFWREVPVPAVTIRLYIKHLGSSCPWGPRGAQTPPGVPQTPPCSPGEDLHSQVAQVSCNASSTAFSWEHSRLCLILSLSKSFPALREPRIPRWVSRCVPLWPSPAKNPPPPCELRVILPHPCEATAPPSPQTGEGAVLTLLQPRY